MKTDEPREVAQLSESSHQILKKYLLELGESITDSRGKPYYHVYSGDSEP